MHPSLSSGQHPPVPNAQKAYLLKTRHDIRSAMHVVSGMSQVLTMSDTLTPSQQKAVTLLKKNAGLTMELIDGLFDTIEHEEDARQKSSDEE